MARHEDSVWYDLGRSLGFLASAVTGKTTHARATGSADGGDAATGAVLSALTALALTGVRKWAGGRPSLGLLLRGAAAGAGAAAVIFALQRLPQAGASPSGRVGRMGRTAVDEIDDLIDRLLAGAGRGLIYAALVQPLLPGPPILRGVLAGTADYLALPLGGLFARLEEISPIRRVPIISALLETGEAGEDSYLTYLGHGAVLGLLYGPSRPSTRRGIAPPGEGGSTMGIRR